MKIREMICTCCGGYFVGRQWHNQDTGHGLGDCCFEYCKERMSEEEFKSCYGTSGVHFNLPKLTPETVAKTRTHFINKLKRSMKKQKDEKIRARILDECGWIERGEHDGFASFIAKGLEIQEKENASKS